MSPREIAPWYAFSSSIVRRKASTESISTWTSASPCGEESDLLRRGGGRRRSLRANAGLEWESRHLVQLGVDLDLLLQRKVVDGDKAVWARSELPARRRDDARQRRRRFLLAADEVAHEGKGKYTAIELTCSHSDENARKSRQQRISADSFFNLKHSYHRLCHPRREPWPPLSVCP